ncbi:AAA family ATPase [Streptacidiphilus sp. N1-10]|uniref:AAA family ATPase n=1 Tax=Streptacidiphilus jeojiensis TaxID=3229225 RepID=A0ABV6XZD9_9ACTN
MLHVSLLGQQAITDVPAGTVLTRSSRALALVAFLVAHAGSPQPRQRIAGLFWPESTDAQALTNLRRELHHLRHVLGDEPALVVTPRSLSWCQTGTCRVDVLVFDSERSAALAAAAAKDSEGILAHASAAIAEYRGELLPGVYDDWLLDVRSELERQCVGLCDLICETRARRGDLTGAVEAARHRIRLQPLEEVGYRALMQLQADLGDRAGAVSTYHHCASVLDRELGLAPDPATRQALQRLMVGADPSDARPPTVEAAVGRSGYAAAQLVGRARELGLLQDLWRTAAAGRPGLALVRGNAGVGKTRLVAEVAEAARLQGAVVAGTQCFGTSRQLALAPVADWVRHPAVKSASESLDPAWRAEVGRLVPSGDPAEREREGERETGARAMVDVWRRHRFFEGLARALIAVGRPMLLILDNVQWCDQETLTFLTFCLGLAPDAPILVAGTLRNDNLDEDPELVDWTVRMRATGLLTELSLSPLEPADTARLAEAISGRRLDEADTGLLQATTGGFPLHVIEAVRSSIDLGRGVLAVGDLTGVLRHRLEQASATAQEVAGLAAAVGTNFTLDLLTEASDLEADAVVGAVDELWQRRIVSEFREGYDFAHDLLREAAYAQISPPRRWLLHRRIAQGLELLHSADTDLVSAQLAEQYARGGRTEQAVAYYRRAADVAAGRFAHSEAIRLHREALSLVNGLPAGTSRDAQELAVLEAMAAPLNARHGYSSPELQQALERSITLAESLGRKDSLLTGLAGLWASRFVQGRTADGYRTAARALSLVGADSELSGPAHFGVGGSAVSLGRPAEGLRHLELAAELTSGAVSLSVGTRPDVHSRAFAAHAHWLLGHDEQARSSCRDAIGLAREIGHPYNLAVALAYGSVTHQMRHDLPALRDAVGELRELCERYGFAYYREWGLILDGWSRTDGSGIGLARRGVRNLRAEGSFARMPYWLSLLADLSTRHDRPDAARATLDAALVGGQARDDLWWLPEVVRMRAAHDSDPAATVSRLRQAARMASDHGSTALLRRCERDLAEHGVRLPTTDAPPAS